MAATTLAGFGGDVASQEITHYHEKDSWMPLSEINVYEVIAATGIAYTSTKMTYKLPEGTTSTKVVEYGVSTLYGTPVTAGANVVTDKLNKKNKKATNEENN